MKKALFTFGWLSCGIIGAGYDNAYFQREYPRAYQHRDEATVAMYLLGGPMALAGFVLFLSNDKSAIGLSHGWSLAWDARRPEDFAAEHKKYGI